METIRVEVDERGIALLELNRPAVLNVLNVQLLTELSAALQALGEQDEVRALIVTGCGRGFCAGADLLPLADVATREESLGQHISAAMAQYFNPMMALLYNFPRPVVSAINGIAAGGGAAIALCADIVLAANSAALKVVQVPQLGIAADLGANWLLPRMAGRARALGACLLGDTLPAARLLEWGVVWECVPDQQLLTRSSELAERLAKVPAETVVASRRLIDSATKQSFEASLEDERQAQHQLCDAHFFSSAVLGFLAR